MKDSKKQISAGINQLQGAAERRHLQKIDTLFKEQATIDFVYQRKALSL